MPAQKLVVELHNAQGQPVADVPVKVTGCGELNSSPVGATLFLPDADQITITVGGQEVYSGALSATPARLLIKQDGGGWKLA